MMVRDEYMYFQDILEDEKEQAREIGLAEGRKEGLKQGREEGRAEGREVMLETARRLLKMNLPIKQIVQATDLSYDEVVKLQNQ